MLFPLLFPTFLYNAPVIWHHGRVVNCKGLQSSKVIGSNPIGASNISPNCYNLVAIFFFFMNTLKCTMVHPLASKSKVKFFGDFKSELRTTLLEIEKLLKIRAENDFMLDWIEVGNHEISIRARDGEDGAKKIVSAIFRYHHDDEKYGNVHIEIVVSELSEKNISHFLGKYLVTNRKEITPNVVHTMLRGLRMHT